MRVGKIIAVIIGALLAVAGFSAAVAGAVLTTAHLTQRDDGGYYNTRSERLLTPTAVLMSRIDLRTGPGDWGPEHPLGTLRVNASRADADNIFVGIAPTADVNAWLSGAAYERVTGMRWGPFGGYESDLIPGSGTVAPPTAQRFWVASAAGPGQQTVTWPSEDGDWAIVVMNADATPGVTTDVSVGVKTGLLLPVGLTAAGFGVLMLGAGVLVMVLAVRTATPATAVPAPAPAVPGSYPARLDGRLEPVSRWMWLVKWFLAIPHVVVLALLWLAVVPLTAVAGVAILFTGRYPRSIFNFNLGVMRWTWRVSFYAFNVLGTDRYPPFSLEPDPTYPADFTVEYPQRLSRGLVLVKWWLLAIPHYVVVAIFAGAWSAGWDDDARRYGTGVGLIGVLVLVAVVVLAFSGRYPEQLFDFVMGMNRWCYRVLAYAGLMRDEYPPFRLDNGGPDPGQRMPQAPPPDGGPRSAELVGHGAGRP